MAITSVPQRIALVVLEGYRTLVSPWLPAACRFHPSCSRYASEAVARYGVLRGGWLAMKRLGRCHPFTRGGFDPVP
jgi:putative membrane protein insertion efficiency factor